MGIPMGIPMGTHCRFSPLVFGVAWPSFERVAGAVTGSWTTFSDHVYDMADGTTYGPDLQNKTHHGLIQFEVLFGGIVSFGPYFAPFG